MAIMTPTGLKIRLGVEWAFALLARLWKKDPATDAFRVLKTCEAIEYVPVVASLIAGLAATIFSRDLLWTIPASLIAGRLIGFVLTQAGMFVVIRPLGLLMLAQIWSYFSYFSILFYVVLLVVLFATLGWVIPALWLAGGGAGRIITVVVEFAYTRRNFRLVGEPVTPAEINFFSAYRLHADRLGLTRDISVTDEEVALGDWQECLVDYAAKYPEAVARFFSVPDDMAIWEKSCQDWEKSCQDAVEKAMQDRAVQDVLSRLGLCRDDLLEFCKWGLCVGLTEKKVFRAMLNSEMLEYFFANRVDGKVSFDLNLKMALWITDGPRSRPTI